MGPGTCAYRGVLRGACLLPGVHGGYSMPVDHARGSTGMLQQAAGCTEMCSPGFFVFCGQWPCTPPRGVQKK